MELDENEEKLLRSVALQNARAVLLARERAERALLEANEALEQKTLELAQQREFFQVTLASIGDAVITTDTDARVTFLNPMAERLTGWQLSAVIGQPLEQVFNLIQEQTRLPVPHPISKVLREDVVVGVANHTVLIARDGREFAIDDSAAPIRGRDGKIMGAVMVFHDVTERKQAEETLQATRNALAQQNQALDETVRQRTAKLQETVLELEAFSYSISHDMRSPLHAMQGYADAILKDYGDKLEPQAANYLERIRRSAARLDLLILDVLAYSRVAKGELQLKVINLETLIADIIQNYPNLSTSCLRVNVSLLPLVLAHEGLLTQIISNLLGNALKFATLDRFPEVCISAETIGPEVRVWFVDNDVGIDPQHHKQIFQIFGRVYPEKQYEGTGIGLAIVKKAAERMGGSAGVLSELGQGSRFWITLRHASL